MLQLKLARATAEALTAEPIGDDLSEACEYVSQRLLLCCDDIGDACDG